MTPSLQLLLDFLEGAWAVGGGAVALEGEEGLGVGLAIVNDLQYTWGKLMQWRGGFGVSCSILLNAWSSYRSR